MVRALGLGCFKIVGMSSCEPLSFGLNQRWLWVSASILPVKVPHFWRKGLRN